VEWSGILAIRTGASDLRRCYRCPTTVPDCSNYAPRERNRAGEEKGQGAELTKEKQSEVNVLR
jgi:hypothetical protein